MQGCRVGGCSKHRSQRLPRLKPRVPVLRREYTAHDFERGFEATSLVSLGTRVPCLSRVAILLMCVP